MDQQHLTLRTTLFFCVLLVGDSLVPGLDCLAIEEDVYCDGHHPPGWTNYVLIQLEITATETGCHGQRIA